MEFLWFLIIGAVAGWLAGLVMKGGGFGLLINIIVGIVGGVIGGWVFGLFNLNLGKGLIGPLVTAFVGAIILLYIASLVKKK